LRPTGVILWPDPAGRVGLGLWFSFFLVVFFWLFLFALCAGSGAGTIGTLRVFAFCVLVGGPRAS